MSFKKMFAIFVAIIFLFELTLVSLTFWGFSSSGVNQVRALQTQNLNHLFQIEQSSLIGNLLIDNQTLLNEQIARISVNNKIDVELTTPSFHFNKNGFVTTSKYVTNTYPIEYAGNTLGILKLSAPVNYGILTELVGPLTVLGGQVIAALLSIWLFRLYSRRYFVKPVSTLYSSIANGTPAISELPFSAPFEFKVMAEKLDTLRNELKNEQILRIEQERQAAIGQLAAQVSHDIRSPLAALKSIISSLGTLDEDKRLIIRHATQRVQDIANNLLVKNNATTQPQSPSNLNKQSVLLSSVLDVLISEKREQFRSKLKIQIEFELSEKSYGLFASIVTSEFKRVISNLVNNAVESILSAGVVKVSLSIAGDFASVSVIDSGSGIQPNFLDKLFTPGRSFGKQNGFGLGLSHAKQTIEAWGGTISIESKLGHGTLVSVLLPLIKPPSWFVPKLVLSKQVKYIVVLDDDNSIHQVWKERFSKMIDGASQLLHFSTFIDLRSWYANTLPSNEECLYLVDLEIAQELTNGFDVIRILNIKNSSYLVTSHFEEPKIVSNCIELGLGLIPKALAGFIPIENKV